MPVLKEKDGIVECDINGCKLRAEFECAICKRRFCERHIRYGRLYGYNISKQNEYYCVACWRIERNNILKYKTSKLALISGLKKLGVAQNDTLLVQSSVSSFGYIEDGAETLIDIIMMLSGKKGTIVMPSFTPFAKRFHPKSSLVDKSCGILPELFRKRFKTARTNNLKYSFTAWGKWAVYIINNAIKYDKLDGLSPVQRVINKSGKILMLGSEFNNCIPIIFADITASQSSPESCGKKYPELEPDIKKLSSYKEIIIGESLCRIADAGEIAELVKSKIFEKPNIFNCYNSNCVKCGRQNKISSVLFEKNRLT